MRVPASPLLKSEIFVKKMLQCNFFNVRGNFLKNILTFENKFCDFNCGLFSIPMLKTAVKMIKKVSNPNNPLKMVAENKMDQICEILCQMSKFQALKNRNWNIGLHYDMDNIPILLENNYFSNNCLLSIFFYPKHHPVFMSSCHHIIIALCHNVIISPCQYVTISSATM